MSATATASLSTTQFGMPGAPDTTNDSTVPPTSLNDNELHDAQNRYEEAWNSHQHTLSQIIPLTSFLVMHNNATPELRCEICDITANSLDHLTTHLKGGRHKKRVAVNDADNMLKSRFANSDVLVHVEFGKWHCVPCDRDMSANAVIPHVEGTRHRNQLNNWRIRNASKIFCTVCKVHVHENEFLLHTQSKQHVDALAGAVAKPSAQSTPSSPSEIPKSIQSNVQPPPPPPPPLPLSSPIISKRPIPASPTNSDSSLASGSSKLNVFAKEFKPAPSSPSLSPVARNPTRHKNSPLRILSRPEPAVRGSNAIHMASPSPTASALMSGNPATDFPAPVTAHAPIAAARVSVQDYRSTAERPVYVQPQQPAHSLNSSQQDVLPTSNTAVRNVPQPSTVAGFAPTVVEHHTTPPLSSSTRSASASKPRMQAANGKQVEATQSVASEPIVIDESACQSTTLSLSPFFLFEIIPTEALKDPNASRLRAIKISQASKLRNIEPNSGAESQEHVSGTLCPNASIVQPDESDVSSPVPRNSLPVAPTPAQGTYMTVEDATMTPSVNCVQLNMANPAQVPSNLVQHPATMQSANSMDQSAKGLSKQMESPLAYTAHSQVRKEDRIRGSCSGGSWRSGSIGTQGSLRSNRSEFYCIMCSVQCNASVPFQQHLNSAGHLRAIGAQGSPPLKKKKGNSSSGSGSTASEGSRGSELLTCEVCQIVCTGIRPFEEHLRSGKHLRKVAACKRQVSTIRSPLTVLKSEARPAAVVGLKPQIKFEKKCNLCNVVVHGEENYMAHLKGKQHAKKLRIMATERGEAPSEQGVVISAETGN